MPLSFADALNSQNHNHSVKVEYDEETGAVQFDGLVEKEGTEPNLDPIYEAIGLKPGDTGYRVLGKLGFSAWQQRTKDGETVWLRAYRGTLVPVAGGITRDEFQSILDRKPKPARRTGSTSASSFIRNTVIGDLQAGKVAERGGTRELAERTNQIIERMKRIMDEEPADTVLYEDPGDAIEGINSAPAQKHTNDMSIPEQLEFSRRALTSLVLAHREHAEHVHVMTCTSNHAAWRDGSGYLGRPGDDFGIDIHRAVQEAFELARFDDVTWHLPRVWEEFTVADIEGMRFALTHGHRARGEAKIMDWWRGQIFAHPDRLTGVKVFTNGHWHHPYATVVGPGQWRVQGSSLDGGSPFFTNMTGESSFPGAVTYRINKETGELQDLRFLEVH